MRLNKRYANHKKSFKNKRYEKDTELSEYIWQLNDNNITYDLKWSVAPRCSPYICGSRKCDLCITEKLLIASENPASSLNTRAELISKCRHRNKFKLKYWDVT